MYLTALYKSSQEQEEEREARYKSSQEQELEYENVGLGVAGHAATRSRTEAAGFNVCGRLKAKLSTLCS